MLSRLSERHRARRRGDARLARLDRLQESSARTDRTRGPSPSGSALPGIPCERGISHSSPAGEARGSEAGITRPERTARWQLFFSVPLTGRHGARHAPRRLLTPVEPMSPPNHEGLYH